MHRDIPTFLRQAIEPVVDGHGLELVDAEVSHGPGGALVRVVLDTPQADGRVPVDLCALVSREIGSCLDAEGSLAAGYRLEVSSPGLDRVLAREKDFANAIGAEVRIETRRPLDGRRRFRGRLSGFDGAVARVVVDGRELAVPFEAVATARQVYEFSRADFASEVGSKHERREERREERRAARRRAVAAGDAT